MFKYFLALLGCALLAGACKTVDASYYSSRRDMLGQPARNSGAAPTNATAQTPAPAATTNAPPKTSP